MGNRDGSSTETPAGKHGSLKTASQQNRENHPRLANEQWPRWLVYLVCKKYKDALNELLLSTCNTSQKNPVTTEGLALPGESPTQALRQASLMVEVSCLYTTGKLSEPYFIVSMRISQLSELTKAALTAVHILNHGLGLGAGRRLGIGLRRQARALVQVATGIERSLERITLPAKDVVAVLAEPVATFMSAHVTSGISPSPQCQRVHTYRRKSTRAGSRRWWARDL